MPTGALRHLDERESNGDLWNLGPSPAGAACSQADSRIWNRAVGALARYVAVLLARSGRRSMCLDVTGVMLADQMLDLFAGDVVLALAYGRAYREVVALFREARGQRLPIVSVTETANSAISA